MRARETCIRSRLSLRFRSRSIALLRSDQIAEADFVANSAKISSIVELHSIVTTSQGKMQASFSGRTAFVPNKTAESCKKGRVQGLRVQAVAAPPQLDTRQSERVINDFKYKNAAQDLM